MTTVAIPEEFRCDPYEISPSGDAFFADKRNVAYVQRCIDEAHAHPEDVRRMQPDESLEEFLNRTMMT